MPKAKYDLIYRDLKEKIESEYYTYQEMLPSEHTLISEYGCSRNTVRRALAELTTEGYVQPMHGKGVRNIFQPIEQTSFTVGGIESFQESAVRNHQQPFTRVLQFAEITADEKIEKKTGFKKGSELCYVQRLRSLDGKPLILDHNYFLKELVKGLTPEIASHSVYDYLEGDLGITIATSKRTLTVEHVTQIDEKYIDMKVTTVQPEDAMLVLPEKVRSEPSSQESDSSCHRGGSHGGGRGGSRGGGHGASSARSYSSSGRRNARR